MKARGITAKVLNRVFSGGDPQEHIFPKKMDSAIAAEVAVETDVIDRIHEDFDKAGQELLDFAQDVLKDADEDTQAEVYSSLQGMGFKNVEEVKEYEEKKKAKLYAKDVASKVGYFHRHYPIHKFITREQVKDICKKYGLVFGKTEWYIGEIPDKNKMEITKFKLREADKQTREPFMIVATEKEFDIERFDLKNTTGWELKPLPKDPIVLAPVLGGYLVVSKWGKEEDLPELE